MWLIGILERLSGRQPPLGTQADIHRCSNAMTSDDFELLFFSGLCAGGALRPSVP